MAKLLLSNRDATGVGDSVSLGAFATDAHTVEMYYTITGGTITALTIALEGSLDNNRFYTLGSHTFSGDELTAQRAIMFITGKTVNYVRANITTLTRTGTASIFVVHQHSVRY